MTCVDEDGVQVQGHKHSIEKLYHFRCCSCGMWWSIGDAPIESKAEWFCPWCGVKSEVVSG